MTHDPLVSIIILHYLRPDTFALTLASVCSQSYPNREIIVVVNGPQKRIDSILEGKQVRVVQLERNLGACAGRNAGIRAAKGDIIITLDNDIRFDDSGAVTRIVEGFDRRPDVHAFAFKVCDGETGNLLVRAWCHPRDWKEFNDREFETDHFNEGACAIRHNVYEVAGLYYEPLFFGAEGLDLVLRMIEQGFRIVYLPSIRVGHLTEDESRPGARPYYFYTRAYIWTAVKDYPFLNGLSFLAAKLSMMLFLAIRTRQVMAFVHGVWDGTKGIPAVLRDRAPVKKSTLRYIRRLEHTRPSLRLRFERHREAVQL